MSTPTDRDAAVTGERWAETLRWIDRQVQAAALTHPHIPAQTLGTLAAAANGYANAPDYPSDDRDWIFGRMLESHGKEAAR